MPPNCVRVCVRWSLPMHVSGLGDCGRHAGVCSRPSPVPDWVFKPGGKQAHHLLDLRQPGRELVHCAQRVSATWRYSGSSEHRCSARRRSSRQPVQIVDWSK